MQTRGVEFKIGFASHAVFIFPGWLAATAWKLCVPGKFAYRKREPGIALAYNLLSSSCNSDYL